MKIFVLKNGEVYTCFTNDDAEYTLATVPDEEIPARPEKSAGIGKMWWLDYVDGVLSWVEKDRTLTTNERIELLQQDIEAIKHEWKAGEAVVIGDRRYYNGIWYECLQAHTTQADWTPDTVVSLWKAE